MPISDDLSTIPQTTRKRFRTVALAGAVSRDAKKPGY